MVWGTGKEKIRAQVEELAPRERERLLLTIYDAENRIVFKRELEINWDMWGGGFLKAMQIDDDPELEIVFCANCHNLSQDSPDPDAAKYFSERFSDISKDPITYNFYLDISSGKIEAKDMNTASSEARELAEIRLSTIKNFSLTLFLIFFAAPFIAIFICQLLMRLFKKPKL